jgi:DNA invertase Pin-like site-specific DNA recombinase
VSPVNDEEPYARTSTSDQVAGIEKQVADLNAYGCDQVIAEHVSAVADDRSAFEKAMAMLNEGDCLVVTTMSRLCRATRDLGQIQERLEAIGAGLEILDLKLDTTTAIGRMTLTIIASVAQMERELMKERQSVGIAKAREQGKYKDRKPTAQAKASEVLKLKASGTLKNEQIAKAVGIGVASVYRILKNSQKEL